MKPIPLFPTCAHCGRNIPGYYVHQKPAHQEPRFCTYSCALAGQPQHASATMRNTGSGQDPATH